MSDTQTIIGIVTLLIGGFGGLVKWCFSTWLADRKEERAERKADREADRAATIQVATAMTTMALKFDAFEKKLESVGNAVEHVADEVTGRHDIPTRPGTHGRMRTEPGQPSGYHAPRRPRQDT